MSRRLLINDMLSALPDHRTFWHDLQEWFACEFVGGPYQNLRAAADENASNGPPATLIIRNASWFEPMWLSKDIPTISLLQDIFEGGPQREMQEAVIKSSRAVVFNSEFTKSRYTTNWTPELIEQARAPVIPLPVDFSTFTPQSAPGCQQALGLPDGCVAWVGAQSAIKGFDIFMQIVRMNPDIPFVAVFKDAVPDSVPPNMRCYARLTHDDLVRVYGTCRVLLCTSRIESQHLAGIEAGGCGLPIVAPQVGVYWRRHDLPGILVADHKVESFTSAVRAALSIPSNPDEINAYWAKEFNPDTVRWAWTKLIEETENAC